ncbi:GNAT family N-acetyltransferase [Flavobacterium sp. FPG59]|jgi:RimJ/RimL family protein N-acetyltransferase|uniref:GNAT family N-acetyltransferase n=1 Tax=Flavobacterium sp. FPG59 TaxID=1929267 RepID=UPI000A3B792E|nr:GNAT family N-acetyltransferase [Flavobacterium sp. FPG59]OUD32052.1 GNAT family N-acetyltransferase [Flavobacterium sp. FPG59]
MKFDFKEKYILENEYVKLQPLENTDFDNLLEYSENEPEIWEFNSGGANGKENLKKYIANAIKNRESEKEYPFIVFDKKSGKFVGSTRFYGIFLEMKIIEIGYTWYGKKYQGSGINKNCKYLMLEFAFDKLEMERVAFAANSKNEKSLNAMKSIGCVVEGVLRNCSTDAKGERIDSTRLSIIKTEWNENVKNNLKKQTENFTNR